MNTRDAALGIDDSALTDFRVGQRFMVSRWDATDASRRGPRHYYDRADETEVEIMDRVYKSDVYGWCYRVKSTGEGMGQTVNETELYALGCKHLRIGTRMEYKFTDRGDDSWRGAICRYGTMGMRGTTIWMKATHPGDRTREWWTHVRSFPGQNGLGMQYITDEPVDEVKVLAPRPRPDYFEVGDVVKGNSNILMATELIGKEITVERIDRGRGQVFNGQESDQIWWNGGRDMLSSYKFDLVKRVDEDAEKKEDDKVTGGERRAYDFQVGDRVECTEVYGGAFTGEVIRQRQYRSNGEHIVVIKRDDNTVDRYLNGEERGGWAVRARTLTLIGPKFDPVDLDEDNFLPGAVVKFTVAADRRGSRLSVGCKMADANSLLESEALKDLKVEAGRYTLTFVATVQAGTYDPFIEIANQKATYGEIEEYATDMLLLQPGSDDETEVEITIRKGDLKVLRDVLGRTPWRTLPASVQEIFGSQTKYMDIYSRVNEIHEDLDA